MWAVIDPSGRVTFREDAATDKAVRQVFGGYRPLNIDVDEDLGATVQISANAVGNDANFPMTALLAGRTTGWTPMLGPVVVVGTDGQLPVELFEQLKELQQRHTAA